MRAIFARKAGSSSSGLPFASVLAAMRLTPPERARRLARRRR